MIPDWAATLIGVVLGISIGLGIGRALITWCMNRRSFKC